MSYTQSVFSPLLSPNFAISHRKHSVAFQYTSKTKSKSHLKNMLQQRQKKNKAQKPSDWAHSKQNSKSMNVRNNKMFGQFSRET